MSVLKAYLNRPVQRRELLPGGLQQIGPNICWLVGDRLFRMAVGVFVLGFVARYLGTAQFGILNYAISLTAIFASVASLGIEGIVIREMVKNPKQTDLILGTALILRLLGGSLAALTVSLAAWITRKESADSIVPLIVVVSIAFLPQSFEVIDLWFQKHILSKFTVLAKAGAVLLGGGVKIFLVKVQAPLVWFCGAVLLDSILSAVALVCVFQGRGESVRRWAVSAALGRSILRDSWPLILSGLLVAIYMRVEQLLVMNMLGSASMGIYYASVRINEMWLFIPTYILSTIYPLMVDKRQTDLIGYHQRLQHAFDLLTGLGYLIALAVSWLAPAIIPWIYGVNFQTAVPILLIQAWTAPIIFSGTVRAQYLLLENRTIYHTWSALIGIGLNVTLALWWIPRLQARGAALAALVGYFVSAYLTSVLFGELRECAAIQTRAFLLPFRLPGLLRRTWMRNEET
jgi:PST family polysaccharide transporter